MARIARVKNNFSAIPNTWLRDKNLSLKAKGLITTMQSLPDGWDFTVNGLASIVKEGRDSVRGALLELKQAGYISWEQKNTDGKFGGNIVQLYENPTTDSPLSENPTTVNPTQYNKDKYNKDKLNKDKYLGTIVPKGESAESEYGNSQINKMFLAWENLFGYKQANTPTNRRAVFNMLRAKDKGERWILTAMTIIKEAGKDRFAPKEVRMCADFSQLLRNRDIIYQWGSQTANRRQSETYDFNEGAQNENSGGAFNW